MKHGIRRLIAVLTLTAAAATGAALATDLGAAAAPPDTTWGAGDTATDTTWGAPPADPGTGDDTPTVTPQDTTWG